MELTPRTFRFLKINGAVLLVFFFTFSLIVLVKFFLHHESNPVSLVVAALLFAAGVIVTGLHWTLIKGVSVGAITVRERGALARR